MILEPASDATLHAKQNAERDALAPSTSERVVLKAAIPPTEPTLRKKRPKGPNPLSVKKKAPKHGVEETKKRTANQVDQADVGSKRKRLDDAEDSASTRPRPKRKRRHTRTSQLSESVS